MPNATSRTNRRRVSYTSSPAASVTAAAAVAESALIDLGAKLAACELLKSACTDDDETR
jgi:hypothetical protein